MLEWLEALDRQLFIFINARWSVEWLNGFMMLLRNAATWVPLYIFILVWSYLKMRSTFWWFLVLTLLTFAVTDFGSSSMLKPWLGRVRPCYDSELQDIIHNLVGCGGRYSMPSSHAANHFGLAIFWFRTVAIVTGKKWFWVWIWAFMIGYAQVYVGKHFPFDIVVGAFTGILAGWGTSQLFYYFYARNFAALS